MAFEKLQQLGNQKFTRIINALMRGEPAMALARKIRTEWGDFPDTSEKALTQQLSRLRLAAAEGMFGANVAEEITKGLTPQIDALEGVSSQVLRRLEELASLQKQRVHMLVNNEREAFLGDKEPSPKPGKVLFLSSGQKKEKPLIPIPQTNAVVNDYAQILLHIQKVRFDLGLDEFKGVIPGMRGASVSQTTTFPDGTVQNTQKTVVEAIATLETIFDRRGVPVITEVPPL